MTTDGIHIGYQILQNNVDITSTGSCRRESGEVSIKDVVGSRSLAPFCISPPPRCITVPYLCSNATCDHATRRSCCDSNAINQNETGAWRELQSSRRAVVSVCLFSSIKNCTFGFLRSILSSSRLFFDEDLLGGLISQNSVL